MGVTKTDLFTEEQNQIALMAKAFAHPARVAILQFLLKTNACINGDLVEELGLAQATISQHLRELKNNQCREKIYINKGMLYTVHCSVQCLYL